MDTVNSPPKRRAAGDQSAVIAGGTAKMTSPDRVVDAIIRSIRIGVYVPGQRLIEADLTRDYRVSRGPVREALKRLAAEGVLTLTRHRGAYVRAMSRLEVRDSLMVLESLVGLMANLAARHIGEDDNAARMREAYRAAFWRSRTTAARRRFSTSGAVSTTRSFRLAAIIELKRMLPLMQIHLLRMQFQAYITPRDREKQFKEYATITETILSGDSPQGAESGRLARPAYAPQPDAACPMRPFPPFAPLD